MPENMGIDFIAYPPLQIRIRVSNFNLEKDQKMQNFDYVYICRSPSVMSRTNYARNGRYSIFKSTVIFMHQAGRAVFELSQFIHGYEECHVLHSHSSQLVKKVC